MLFISSGCLNDDSADNKNNENITFTFDLTFGINDGIDDPHIVEQFWENSTILHIILQMRLNGGAEQFNGSYEITGSKIILYYDYIITNWVNSTQLFRLSYQFDNIMIKDYHVDFKKVD